MNRAIEEKLDAILNSAAIRLKTLKFYLETNHPDDVIADARGHIDGMLDAARILTIAERVGDPDSDVDVTFYRYDADGIYAEKDGKQELVKRV